LLTHTETALKSFEADWQEWHAAHERHRAHPHGFLAVTHLHWLIAEPTALDGVSGTWSATNDAVTVVLEPGEVLELEQQPLPAGETVIGPIAERGGLNLTSGETVIEVAKRGGEYIVRPRHPENELLRGYQGTPAYSPDAAYAVRGTYVPFEVPRTTYAANRSLSVVPAADGSVELDFNRAVNLPCAYTDLATCPLPPAENRLPVPIEAGEKIPYERQDQQ
jgi:uncharacterized protein